MLRDCGIFWVSSLIFLAQLLYCFCFLFIFPIFHQVANKFTSYRSGIHLRLERTESLNGVIPVSLDAASVPTVCSNVKITGLPENGLCILQINRAPASNIARAPGCVPSILRRAR